MQRTEQWEMVELTFQGKEEGNPFTDYKIYVAVSYTHLMTETRLKVRKRNRKLRSKHLPVITILAVSTQ